jgi:hypothetical protein
MLSGTSTDGCTAISVIMATWNNARNKCRLGYISASWEAHGHYATLRSAHVTPFSRQRSHPRPVVMERGATLAGVPWRAYWEVAVRPTDPRAPGTAVGKA